MPVVILPSCVVAVLGALIGFRVEVVRFAPQTASLFAAIGLPVNLRGLAFENVRTTGEVHEGVPVLIVEGTIGNVVEQDGRGAAAALRVAQPPPAMRSMPGRR